LCMPPAMALSAQDCSANEPTQSPALDKEGRPPAEMTSDDSK
jgi:hypothetical protein